MALALAMAPLYDRLTDSAGAFSFRFRVGPIPMTWLELALVIAIAAGLIGGWGRLPWRNPYTWPGLLLLAAATISVAVAPDRREALGAWKAYFLEPMLAGVVIAWLATVPRRRNLLLAGLAAGGLIAATGNLVAGLQALAAHVDIVHAPAVAFYRTANALALFLVPLDAFALAIALHLDERRPRRLAAAFLVLTVPAVLLSLSRGGLVALAVTLVAVGLFSRARLVVAGAVIAALGGALAVPGIRRRLLVELEFSNPDNTINTRLALWRSALAMLRAHPVFGGGLAGFQTAVEPYRVPEQHEHSVHPHNLVLNFWTETGLLGLAAFVWIGVQLLRTAVTGLAGDPWRRALSIGLIGTLTAIVVHGMVDVPYFKNDLSLEFWALVAIQLAALRPRGADNLVQT